MSHELVRLLAEHEGVSRRFFLGLGTVGAAALSVLPLAGLADQKAQAIAPELAEAIARLNYLTPADDFQTVERGNPLPYTLPPDKLAEVGLERDTWKLEVVPDVASKAKVERPLSKDLGTALDFPGLMKLAEKHAVKFLKVISCNNIGSPLGMGLWEGVPLREVVWLTKPVENIRRVYYHGYHNDDPKQLFQSSLPIGRVLEDPPGEYPIILCYKLNGELLSGKRGGPVRMVVPDGYGFKSVKWLTKVVLTNLFHANDTYADGNNDIDSWMKTFARFVSHPTMVKAGQPIPITGLAQVGISGLSKVQFWLHPREVALPKDDPHFTAAPWKDAEILPPPAGVDRWGGKLPDNRLPENVVNFDASGKPKHWPLRYALAHWAALATDVPAGKYHLRCRTIDERDIAQPLPRPFQKSGQNAIQQVALTVE